MLYEDKPVIDCKVSFDFNGQMIGHPTEDKRDWHSGFIHEEKLRFKLFHQLDKASVGIRDLPFAISETSDKYIEGNYWTAMCGEYGLFMVNTIMSSLYILFKETGNKLILQNGHWNMRFKHQVYRL